MSFTVKPPGAKKKKKKKLKPTLNLERFQDNTFFTWEGFGYGKTNSKTQSVAIPGLDSY